MSKKVFITRRIPDTAIQLLTEKGYEVDINETEVAPPQKKLIKLLKKKPYDAVITLLTDPIDSKVFDAVPDIKLYANYATGFDNIDILEAEKRGITVTNAPAEASTEAVAEHTIALMLALMTHLVEADTFVRNKKYKGWSPLNFMGNDFVGKTLGLVGTGRIGSQVAFYAKKLGLHVVYFDLKQNEAIEKELGAHYFNSVDEVLKNADVVSLHVPLTNSTRHLIDGPKLKLMKPTSILINTSRGPIIDEKALVLALQEKTLAGAALDVFEFEPHITPGLLKLENTVLTPHIASAKMEARNEMARITAENVINFLEGKRPPFCVTAHI